MKFELGVCDEQTFKLMNIEVADVRIEESYFKKIFLSGKGNENVLMDMIEGRWEKLR